MIDIHLNGELRQFPAASTVHDLAASLDLGSQAVAIAVNRAVVPRQRWSQQLLQAQDQIEIVRAIGGG